MDMVSQGEFCPELIQQEGKVQPLGVQASLTDENANRHDMSVNGSASKLAKYDIQSDRTGVMKYVSALSPAHGEYSPNWIDQHLPAFRPPRLATQRYEILRKDQASTTENACFLSLTMQVGIALKVSEMPSAGSTSPPHFPTAQDKANCLQAVGKGLEITISQRIVKVMNSEIQVGSKLNAGSCFFFSDFMGVKSQQSNTQSPSST